MTVHNKKSETVESLEFPSEVARRQWDMEGSSLRLSRAALEGQQPPEDG